MLNCDFARYIVNPPERELEGDPDGEVSGKLPRTIDEWREIGQRFDRDLDRASKKPRKHFRSAPAEITKSIGPEVGR